MKYHPMLNCLLTGLLSLCLLLEINGATPITNCITQYPYAESFENGFGAWNNATGDDFEWTRMTGGTPSNGTGPASAAAGIYYMYMEASSPNYPSKIAILEGPCYDLSSLSAANFEFQYHMYGSDIGQLRLEISTNGGSSWTQLWSLSGTQDNAWHIVSVDLISYVGQSNVQLRFWGQTGATWSSDMAIDGLSLNDGSGGGGTACSAAISSFPYTESFETGLGNWTEEVSSNIWQRRSGGTTSVGTGPSSAVDGSYYMYIEASSPNYPNKTAILQGPCYDLAQLSAASFSFAYHMYGAHIGQLRVEGSTDEGTTWFSIWTKAGDQGNNWYQSTVDLSAYLGAKIQLRFHAVTGTSYQGDIAIDQLQLTTTPVTYPSGCGSNIVSAFPYYESFEVDWGLWAEVTPNGIWRRHQGSTGSSSTGPTAAYNGSWYTYTEASSPNYPNKIAILEGPCFELQQAVSATLQFAYHMYSGNPDPPAMGNIRLEISTNEGSTWNSIWSKSGNQGNLWHTATIDLTDYVGQTIRLRFYRNTGSHFTGDFAVDNLSLDADETQASGNLIGQVIHPATYSCSDTDYIMCCEPSLSGSPVANVIIDMHSSPSGQQLSGLSNGSGIFDEDISAGMITLTPFANSSNWLNGVSTFDLVSLQKHVDRSQLIDCPLRRLAGDVDNDGDLDNDDVNTIRELILNTQTSFSQVPNWRFVPKIYMQTEALIPDAKFKADFWNLAAADDQGAEYPFKGDFNYDGQSLSYNGLPDWMNGIVSWPHYPSPFCSPGHWDLYIIKSGDVSGNASATGFDPNPPPPRVIAEAPSILSSVALHSDQRLNISDQSPAKIAANLAKNGNKKYDIRIVANTPEPVQAYQIGLHFDPEILELGKIKPNKADLQLDEIKNFGLAKKAAKAGEIRTLWINDFTQYPEGLSMAEGLTLFTFEFKTDAPIEVVRHAFALDSAVLVQEFYGANGLIEEVDLQVFVEE